MPALIRFVQLTPKSHHVTVRQEAAEEPTGNTTNYHSSGLRLGIPVREIVNSIPIDGNSY